MQPIKLFTDKLTPEQCDVIVEFFNRQSPTKLDMADQERYIYRVRTKDEIDPAITQALSRAIAEYFSEYMLACDGVDDGFLIQRHIKGEVNCTYIMPHDSTLIYATVFLTDVPGKHIEFTSPEKLELGDIRKGTVLVFPASFPYLYKVHSPQQGELIYVTTRISTIQNDLYANADTTDPKNN